jgi:cellulose synthase/poly-beta-1,6-N-acetylglucosamine synthase-like glycosyltransferase
MNLPKISVNIPLITNGDASIVLNSLLKIEYPKRLYEIIIIQGSHLTKQRNIGLKVSKGEIIYLLDDDSYVHPQSFKILADEFRNPKIAAVGGPSLTPQDSQNYLNQLIGYVLETYFGAFRMRYKWSNHVQNIFGRDYHFIGANLALRRKVAIAVGRFDEKIIPNEETELLRRLRDIGYLLKFNKDLFIYRNQRKTYGNLQNNSITMAKDE